MNLTIGDPVVWHHVPKGGRGYAAHISATVIAVTDSRIVILVPESEDRVKRVHVRPHLISPATQERCDFCGKAVTR